MLVVSIGKTMLPTSGWYTILNPAHPEVISHLRNLSSELLKYDIDGLHLDYIRYPYDYLFVVNEIYPSVSKEDLKSYADFSYDIHTYSKRPSGHPASQAKASSPSCPRWPTHRSRGPRHHHRRRDHHRHRHTISVGAVIIIIIVICPSCLWRKTKI